ncbi:MAG: hypothetical protein JNK78_13975 [Planctomycetes bacterium]|nr:hypothetical protein [Planctomycetota bacterium]
MSARIHSLAAGVVAALSIQGCAVAPDMGMPRRLCFVRTIALPVDVSTGLAAAAVRHALPFSDPVLASAGAPASANGPGFEIAYECTPQGCWIPVANARIRFAAKPGGIATEVDALCGNRVLRSLGGAAGAKLLLRCVPTGDSTCAVEADLPPAIADRITEALDRAFALAAEPDTPALGLGEPNLRAFSCDRLLRGAADDLGNGRPQRAAERLHLATRLADGVPEFQRRIALLSTRTGDGALATDHAQQAMLIAQDPVARASWARRVSAAEGDDRAIVADRAVAELMLHSARRLRPAPAQDYEVLRSVHEQNEWSMGALACALLAREHTFADGAAVAPATQPIGKRPFDLALRFAAAPLTLPDRPTVTAAAAPR